MAKSPYLEGNDRLADVIAAIQALGTYKFYKLEFKGWSDRISGDETLAQHWRDVFEQHPEFFRLDSQRNRASLVWRRQHQKLFDVDTERQITRAERNQLTSDQKRRISRMPLGTQELSTLIQTAIELHSRALEHKREGRWWVHLAVGLLGVIIGASIPILAGQLGPS